MNERLTARLRSAVPVEIRILRNRARRAARVRASLVRDGMHLRLDSTEELDIGPVSAISIVRDEADILARTLQHLLNQEVDSLIIADHGSIDSTPQILAEWASRMPVVVFEDREPGHLQAEKMNHLARYARDRGAKWIVPFDADEFWFASKRSLGAELRSQRASILSARMHNVFPAHCGEMSIVEAGRLDLTPSSRTKVAFRPRGSFAIADGNHSVLCRGRETHGLYIAHFPWRTFAQFERKVRVGNEALSRTSHGFKTGWHWRYLGGLSDSDLHQVWSDIVDGSSDHPIAWNPVGPFACVSIADAKNWGELSPYRPTASK